jgi:hypothetical protein
MCIAVTCSTCGGVTWAGCGDHVQDVLGSFPEDEHCRCAASTP